MRELHGLSFDEACSVWVTCDRPPAAGSLPSMSRVPTRLGPRRVDGRRLRSERTSQLIIEAYLALLREICGCRPRRRSPIGAGYSVRSVFERFPDLYRSASLQPTMPSPWAQAQAVVRDVDGDRSARIRSAGRDTLPDLRAMAAAVARAQCQPGRFARAQAADQAGPRADHEAARADVSPRTGRSPMTAARKHTLIALEALTDFESWARMRELYGLSVEQALRRSGSASSI